MKTIKEYPTQQQVRDMFDYVDGHLISRPDADKQRKEYPRTKGYISFSINGSNYLAHRLVYIWHYGSIPDGYVIDHINDVRDDNRIENLQPLTVSQNTQRQKRLKSVNTSGYRGVGYNPVRDTYRAEIGINGRNKRLGYFKTAEQAALAYDQAAMIHYGRFATLNFNQGIIDAVNRHLGPIRLNAA